MIIMAGLTTEPLLSLKELSALVGVPVNTLYRWRYQGEGPKAYRLGRHVRYRRSDVEAWLASCVETSDWS
ncbi:MAG TPA: helix-turn-helix domain-containing protein [Microlunatus sp.]